MAYMRGQYYVWDDDESIYINTEEMPLEVFDELLVMRLAELTAVERKQAEKRAIKNWSGNIGCDPLRKRHGLETTIERLHKRFDKA